MVTHRAFAPLVVAVLLIGGVSVASGQRPGMGPRPGGGGPGGPPVALGFRWIDAHVHLIAERSDFRGAVAAAVAAMDDAGMSKMVVLPPPNVSGGRLWDVPPDLAKKIGSDTAMRLYKLDGGS